ncbi:hypothetical protein [Rhizobium leguminosarum]
MTGLCDTTERTYKVTTYNNNQYWTIEVSSIQIKSSVKIPGYIQDSGVMVSATKLPPHGTPQIIDPCVANRAPIQGTLITASATVTYKGNSAVVSIKPLSSPPGKFFKEPIMGLDPQLTVADGDDVPLPELSFRFEEGSVEAEA